MLKINNIKLNKYRIPLITSLIVLGGIFLYQYLTFIPEYSSAESKSISTDTPVTITPTTPLAKWEDLEYMQQMSPEACNSVATPDKSTTNAPAKQLIDIRDGKTYWVSKLSDGNCWMTQNLDLDLEGVTLTPDDSNVSTDWESDTGSSTTSGYNNSNSYLAQYYDPGYSYYTNGTTKTNSNEALAKDQTGNVNAHWMLGNLYSWTAATAGTGTSSMTSGNVTDSICPKGWQLPTSNNTDAAQKSFGGLTTAYGIANSSTGSTAMRSAPRYFIYGGNVIGGSFVSAGICGFYWSSTAYGGYHAYGLYLDSSNAGPSDGNYRYIGFSVRCVAQSTSSETPVDPSVGGNTGINDPNVSVTVPNILTMSISDSVVDIEASTNKVNEGNFTASVSSNAPYSIAISTTKDGHTDLTNENGSGAIPTLSSTSPVITMDDSKWWGIKCTNPDTSTNCQKTTYTGLTDYLHPTIYFKSATAASNQLTTFTIGIKTSPDLPSGTYSTNILVTASQN